MSRSAELERGYLDIVHKPRAYELSLIRFLTGLRDSPPTIQDVAEHVSGQHNPEIVAAMQSARGEQITLLSEDPTALQPPTPYFQSGHGILAAADTQGFQVVDFPSSYVEGGRSRPVPSLTGALSKLAIAAYAERSRGPTETLADVYPDIDEMLLGHELYAEHDPSLPLGYGAVLFDSGRGLVLGAEGMRAAPGVQEAIEDSFPELLPPTQPGEYAFSAFHDQYAVDVTIGALIHTEVNLPDPVALANNGANIHY